MCLKLGERGREREEAQVQRPALVQWDSPQASSAQRSGLPKARLPSQWPTAAPRSLEEEAAVGAVGASEGVTSQQGAAG